MTQYQNHRRKKVAQCILFFSVRCVITAATFLSLLSRTFETDAMIAILIDLKWYIVNVACINARLLTNYEILTVNAEIDDVV